MKHTHRSLIFILAFFIFSKWNAQTDLISGQQLIKNLTLNSGDSLIGFDESFYKAMALQEGFIGDEFHVFMYQKKREFIHDKFKTVSPMTMASGSNVIKENGSLYGKLIGGGQNIINAAPCVNEDFELNNFSGWTITSGVNNNSCTYNLCPTPGSAEAFIRTTPYADVNFPGNTLPNSPLGGTRVAQLNNNIANGGLVTRLAQTFPVTGNNALFQFAYAAAFNSAHACCSQPFLNIYVKNCQNQLLACPQISVVSPGPGCVSPAPGFTNTGSIYKCLWQVRSIDLSAYIGSCVTIEVTVGDCSGWAHWGYVYFDALCGPMNIIVNGVTFPAGTQASTVTACGVNSATITAPPGLQPYVWNGPPGSGVTNNPNQTIVGNISGVYTLNMNPPGSCAPIVKLITLVFSPQPTAGIVYTNQCNIFTFTNTGNPAPAVQTFSFAGPGVVPSFTTLNQINQVPFPVQGTYTVTQVVTNTAGCTASVQAIINVPLAPNVAFSTPTPTQCFNGNSFVFTAADPTGVHQYSFSPGPGAPPVGNVPTYGPVSFSQPGTYTVTHSMTAGGCTSFSNMVVVINPQPTPTVGSNSPICINSTILLSASGGTSYAWSGPLAYTSSVQNPTITNATLGMSGTYSVLVTSAVGCTALATTNVTVYALPSPTITSNSPVCMGTILTLTASGGSNYNWVGPNSFTSNIANPVINNVQLAASGIYTLIAGAGTCTVSTTSSITINPLPVVTASNSGPVCLNTSLTLNAGGGVSYSWVGPNNYSANGQNQLIPMVTNNNAGTYTVTVVDANTCVNSTTTNVVINPLPNLSVNHPTSCVNGTIQFTASGALNYAWSGPNNFTSLIQNPFIPNANVILNGPYVLIGTSVDGCTASAISNVSVTPLPIPLITANDPCVGNTLSLSASGAVNYTWTGPGGFISYNPINNLPNVTLLDAGVYTLVASAASCTNLTSFDVTVHPLPVPVINRTNPVCYSQPITFTASGGVSYLWTGPNSYTSNATFPVISYANHQIHNGIYTLLAIDGYSCMNTATTSIEVLPLPIITVFGSTVCIGQKATAFVTGGVSYEWTGPNNFLSAQSNIEFPKLTPLQVGIYTVVITGTNNCKVKASTPIINYPVPTPTASNNGPVCLNGEIKFFSSGGHVYEWKGPNNFVAHAQNTILKNANSMNYNGTYTLGVIDDKGCQGYTTTDVVIRNLPTATLATNAPNQCVPFCAQFTAKSTSSLTNISWNMDGTGVNFADKFDHCFKVDGRHVLTSKFTDEYGCSNQADFVVNAYPIPLADFHIGPGEAVENEDIDLIDASLGDGLANWTWYLDNTSRVVTQRNTRVMYEKAGTYPVAMILTNIWGCKDTVVKQITIGEEFRLYVPNAFSPNNDGINDTFQPKGYGIRKFNLMIFDRWGEKLFTSDDFSKVWDGTFKGEICKEDTYVWRIVATGPDDKERELKGKVTIIK